MTAHQGYNTTTRLKVALYCKEMRQDKGKLFSNFLSTACAIYIIACFGTMAHSVRRDFFKVIKI
jgi:hypothetical protein